MNSAETKNLVNTLRQLTQLCFDSVEAVSGGERFSVAGFREVHSLRMHILQISKMLYNFDYLSSEVCERCELHLESFKWSEFDEGLSELFKYVLTPYTPPQLSFTNSFNIEETFLSDKRRFDILLLNALYVISSQYNAENRENAKITLHLGQNDKYFILHIRNIGKLLDEKKINSILKSDKLIIPEINPGSKNIDASIYAMKKAAEELLYKLEFSNLKSGNKFEIFIPKFTTDLIYTLNAPKRYVPKDYTGLMIFSDLYYDPYMKYMRNNDWL